MDAHLEQLHHLVPDGVTIRRFLMTTEGANVAVAWAHVAPGGAKSPWLLMRSSRSMALYRAAFLQEDFREAKQ